VKTEVVRERPRRGDTEEKGISGKGRVSRPTGRWKSVGKTEENFGKVPLA